MASCIPTTLNRPVDPCPECAARKPFHNACARCRIMIGPTHMEPFAYRYEGPVRKYQGRALCGWCIEQLAAGAMP